MKRPIFVWTALVLLFASLPVYAGPPLDAIRLNVNSVLDVLRDPKLKAAANQETRKEKLRLIYDRMFDDIELSKRTLSRHWNSLSVEQRKEFVPLFRQVLEKAYIDKILAYSDEKVLFDKEIMVSDTQAEVQTIVVTSSKEIPIFYKVIQKGGAWKVYDIVIENVSLALNYRTQFNDILAKNTPDQLLEILRKKVKGQ